MSFIWLSFWGPRLSGNSLRALSGTPNLITPEHCDENGFSVSITFITPALKQCSGEWEGVQAGTRGSKCSLVSLSQLIQSPELSLPGHHLGRPEKVHDEHLDSSTKDCLQDILAKIPTPSRATQLSHLLSENKPHLAAPTTSPRGGVDLLETYLYSRRNGHDDASALQSLVTSFDMEPNEVLRELELQVQSSLAAENLTDSEREPLETLCGTWRARRERSPVGLRKVEAPAANQAPVCSPPPGLAEPVKLIRPASGGRAQGPSLFKRTLPKEACDSLSGLATSNVISGLVGNPVVPPINFCNQLL